MREIKLHTGKLSGYIYLRLSIDRIQCNFSKKWLSVMVMVAMNLGSVTPKTINHTIPSFYLRGVSSRHP